VNSLFLDSGRKNDKTQNFLGKSCSCGTFAGFRNLLPFEVEEPKGFLNKCIKYTEGLVGKSLRHLFGMMSKPQTFFIFIFNSLSGHNVWIQ
jgi:hypothetical protein